MTDVGNGKLMAYLAAHGEILSQRFHEDKAFIHCRIAAKYLGRMRDNPQIVIHERKGDAPAIPSRDVA